MFRRAPTPSAPPAEVENPYLLSFADIMAGLLGLFILALICVMLLLDQQKHRLADATAKAQINAAELRTALDQIDKTIQSIQEKIARISVDESRRTGLLSTVEATLAREGVVVIKTQDGLRIPDDTLSFPKGSHAIPPEKRRNAERIGTILQSTLQQPENMELFDTIFVEGHTDSVPNRREMGNWGLSTYRAISLWNFWTDTQGVAAALRALRNTRGQPLFSVSGYADTRPVVEPPPQLLRQVDLPNPPPDIIQLLDEPKNRRIDLRFTLRGSEEVRRELQKEVDDLQSLQRSLRKTLDTQ